MEEDMEGLMTAFADEEKDSCYRNFLNNDADFILRQLFSNEVGEGSSSGSLAPPAWSFLEYDTNLTEARQSIFHPVGSIYSDSNHLSTQYGFSDHREVGMFPEQLSNSNVPTEYYTTDVFASSVPFCYYTIAEDIPFVAGFEMSLVEPDILISIPNKPLSLKRNLDFCISEVPNKKPWAMKNDCGDKTKTLPKKNWKTSMNSFELEAVNSCKQMSTSSHSSEDDSNSNSSLELNPGTSSDTKLVTSHDKKGKKKGRKGTTIDPQSLYAKKRRDRINERLRILQNLVPNGTKVDISTMLEEAVNYVKFLQTQIKLLSSDNLWMYAPIAYNGVDVGLDRRLSHNL